MQVAHRRRMRIGLALSLLLAVGCGERAQDAGGTPASEPDAATAACGAAGIGAVTLTTTSTAPLAIASDGTDLFWLDTFAPGSPATLHAVPVGGGAPRVVTAFSLWNAWVGYCDVTYPAGSDDPGGGTDTSCNTFSIVVEGGTVYAIGPVGVVSAPKAGGAATALVTLDVPNDYVLGPAVSAGGSLYWVQQHLPDDPDVTISSSIQRLDLSTGAATTLVAEPASGATDSAVAADANHVYWVSGGGIQATTLTGSATTTVVSGTSLNPDYFAIAGDQLIWVNQEVSGGTCGLCGPPPTPQPEMVQFAPASGGTTSTLITYPQATDPSVSVFGDSTFVYVVAAPLAENPGDTNGTLQAYRLGDASSTTLLTGVPLDLVAMDACSVYFASGNTLQKVAKPAQ